MFFRFLPWLVFEAVDRRLRFKSKLSGRVIVGCDVQGLKHVNFGGSNAVGSGSVFASEIIIGYGTTIGSNDYLVGPIKIGNYCQIGAAVGIYGRDHPLNRVTMYFNQILFEGRLKQYAVVSDVRIGHDVWIGHGAIILKGVEIGNGAVIGAGSIVTKDIPEYAIAVGNPARVLRMRFDDDIIALLKNTQWWLNSAEKLAQFEEVFHLDLNANRDKTISLLQAMAAALHNSGTEVVSGSEKL
jgi:acetyltransferase-like isoleucine patch superfamily enzyme